MKIRIDDIGEEEAEVDFQTDLAAVNQILASPTATDFRFAPVADVALRHYRIATDVFFNGHIAADVSGICARCLESYPFRVDRDVSWAMKPGTPAERAEAEKDADAALAFYEGDEIDLDPLVREELLVTLPTRPLCAEDCAGLCPQCGTNRNVHTCNCAEERGDPRLAVLRDLKPSRG